MKKIVISLAGLLAAVAFAPEASAVPSFARQTGVACTACHWQSYPALNSFGRAFKASGYTMMGAQDKVEGEHGLSIPSVLNASLYTQLRYNKTNGTAPAATAAGNKNNGRFDMPDEMALFVAGRGSEHIGFVAEIGLVGNAAGSGASIANFKMPFVFGSDSVKISAIPFFSSGIGASYGFDLFATGSNGAGRITENGMSYSAAMYMGATNNPGTNAADATGLALVASNENFHVNITPYTGVSAQTGGQTTSLGATYLRAAWTPSYNNWDLGIGFQNWSGKPSKGRGGADYAQEAKLYVIDGQALGEVSGMPLGIYASYGSAEASAAVAGAGLAGMNTYNSGVSRKSAFGIMGDLWVIPGTLGLQLGIMRAKTGQMQSAVVGSNESDNSYTLGARYKIRQNVKMGVAYTKFSGTAYDIGGSGGTNSGDTSNVITGVAAGVDGASAARGNQRLTVILSAGF